MLTLRVLLVCCASLLCCPSLASQQPPTAAALRGHVEVLANDRLDGRGTGTEGGLAAAHYIAGVLAGAGCEPAGDDGSWFQKTDVWRHELSSPGQLVLLDEAGGERELSYGADWQIFTGGPIEGTFDIVYVASLEELPAEPSPGSVLVLIADFRQAYGWLGDGATDGWPAVLLMGPSTPGRPADAPSELISASENPLLIMARGDVSASLMARSWQQLRLNLGAARSSPSFNVLGRLPGAGTDSEPSLATETVVISAHYDHITGQGGEPGEDQIYNGADDDASGVAAVLELARMAGQAPAPARTLLFLLVTGEEHGLLGTEFYLDHPATPLEQTVYNLNFEMIGRPDALVGGPGQLWLTGFELSNVGPAWAGMNLGVLPDPRPKQQFFRRSDNYAFVERGVVAQSLSSYDLHDDYHRPSDEADRLDYEHMAATLRLSWRALEPLASGALDPAWSDDSGLSSPSGR